MVWLHQRYALIGIGLLILMVLGSQGAIQVPPISKAVFLGASNVTMSCTSDTGASNIKWSHMQVGDPSGVYLAFGSFVEESQKNLYAVEQVGSQQIDLIILNVTMEMLGTYYCRDITEPKAYAQLIIIDSEPVCSMTPAAPLELMYSDTVEMSCNFSYFADASYVSGDLIWSKGSPATIIASFTETNTSANDNLITAASKLTQTPGNVNPFPIHRCNATFKFTDKMTHISSKSVDYSKSVQLFDSPIFVLVDPESLLPDMETTNAVFTDPSLKGQSKGLDTGALVGIVVGIGCALLIAAAAIYFYRRKKKQAGSNGSKWTQNKPPDDVAMKSSNTNLSKQGQQDLSQQQDLSKEGKQDLSKKGQHDLSKKGQHMTSNANNSSRNNSVYSVNGNHDQRCIDEDELNYAELELEDFPHSLQAIQLVEESTYSDVRLA